MKHIFMETAEHCVAGTDISKALNELPKVIHRHTDWEYTCTMTDSGCFLKPTFRNMPYRNSFVPEIDVVVSRRDTQTVLQMSGQPVKGVRVFMAIWIGILLIFEALLLSTGLPSDSEELITMLGPAGMCIMGYLICKIPTKFSFRAVMKAIRKEL